MFKFYVHTVCMNWKYPTDQVPKEILTIAFLASLKIFLVKIETTISRLLSIKRE